MHNVRKCIGCSLKNSDIRSSREDLFIMHGSCACTQGLGEVYEEEYVAATASGATTAVDKQDAVRREAKVLMNELFGKLDALSHFHYAPKPVIEEMQVRADVPALAMEEVGAQVPSWAQILLLPCALLWGVGCNASQTLQHSPDLLPPASVLHVLLCRCSIAKCSKSMSALGWGRQCCMSAGLPQVRLS